MTLSAQLDLSLLNGYIESLGKETVEKMLTMYESQSLIYMQAIEKALVDNDSENWTESCHKMKGAAGSSGFINIHLLLVDMEKNTGDSSSKREQMLSLKMLNIVDVMAFKDWLEQVT